MRGLSLNTISSVAALAVGSVVATSFGGKGPSYYAYADSAESAAPKPEAKAKAVPKGYRVDKAGTVHVSDAVYERVDDKMFRTPKLQKFVKDHALHETLKGDKLVERYEIYRKKGADEIMAIVRFGQSLNGHPTIVHGGITSLVFDNSYGWLFFCLKKPASVTANLVVNYRAPLKQNTTAILKAKLTGEKGRKLFMDATLHEPFADGSEQLIADSNTLFIKMRLTLVQKLWMMLFPDH
jgi:acyl-coenzyme A thioesterase PaaI-like protein